MTESESSFIMTESESDKVMTESESDKVIHICPEESDLGYVGPAACPTCNTVFPSRTACELHQIKKHNKKSQLMEKKPKRTYRYYCPISGCKYNRLPDRNLDLTRYFTKMKYLQQHYVKSHAKKAFICAQCDKSYPSPIQLSTHKRKECGIEFSCIQCDTSYKSREALLTHCSRTGHIRSAFQTKRKGKIEFVLSSKGHYKKILPKPLAPAPHLMENIAAAALSELSRKPIVRTGVDVCTQTEVVPEPRKRAKMDTRDAATNSSSTQTDNDRIFPEADSDSLMTDMVLRQYFTSATQTNQAMDFDLAMFQDIDQHVNNETQTELLPNNLMLDDDIPVLSDTHTQTAAIDLDEYSHNCTQTADLDDYSHNCTQTCDDIFLNDFVELSDIETQTAWASLDSFLVSAQTQTLL